MAENAPKSMLCLWLQWQENKGEDRIFYLWKELLCMKETKLIHSLIKPLNPLLIYLYQYNFKESFPQIIAERPSEWLDFITWYYTEQGYGRSKGLNGVEGLLEVLELRKAYELAILKELPIDSIQFDKSMTNWTTIHSEISSFLQIK
jgi:hypothetical protein